MKYLLRITLAATLFANSAHALSCMRPNLARTFNNAAASKDTFHVAYGKIKPTQKVVDPTPELRLPTARRGLTASCCSR